MSISAPGGKKFTCSALIRPPQPFAPHVLAARFSFNQAGQHLLTQPAGWAHMIGIRFHGNHVPLVFCQAAF